VFFDALGIKYEYEHEAYHLSSGNYLPDFWLPDLRILVEVKGCQKAVTEEVKLTLAEMADEMMNLSGPEPMMLGMALLIGSPSQEKFMVFESQYCGINYWEWEFNHNELQLAVNKARRARFGVYEH
jgi:hypothetical protein